MITRAWRPFALATLVLTCILPAGQALAERITFRIAGWNMESGESSDDHLRRQIGEKNGIDLWGFSEVRNRQAAEAFSQRAAIGEGGAEYDLILGEGGGADRLAIVYNKRRLQLVSARELSDQVFERHRRRSSRSSARWPATSSSSSWSTISHEAMRRPGCARQSS